MAVDADCRVGVSQSERVGFDVHNWGGVVREGTILLKWNRNHEWE